LERSVFGTLENGAQVHEFKLINKQGALAKVVTYGATLTELSVPDRTGKLGDVVLGFDRLQGYRGRHPWFGSTVGRVANRIANGKFTLDQKEYSLELNNPPHHLHGGTRGLSHVIWDAEPLPGQEAVRFSYHSPDGNQGMPGNLDVTVTYCLTDRNELRLDYTAQTDAATPINLTNHSYFNLDAGNDILGNVLYLNADYYTPVDATLIPTGEIAPVKGTPLDFTQPRMIGERIAQMKGDPGGYDNNFVVNGRSGELRLAARVSDPGSGRQLEAWTTEPAIQFYSGNFLDGSITGKRGVVYGKHSGFCLEAQHFPDSVNHPNFPSTILRPGKVYRQVTIYRFAVK
jgi:aldose 1-epimerase